MSLPRNMEEWMQSQRGGSEPFFLHGTPVEVYTLRPRFITPKDGEFLATKVSEPVYDVSKMVRQRCCDAALSAYDKVSKAVDPWKAIAKLTNDERFAIAYLGGAKILFPRLDEPTYRFAMTTEPCAIDWQHGRFVVVLQPKYDISFP